MKKTNDNIKLNKKVIVLGLFSFLILVFRVSFLSLSVTIDGINIKEFKESRSIVSKSIKATRGSIYDKSGNVLAQNVASYTLIAYIDPIRSEAEDELYHVADKALTASALSKVIDMKEEDIYDILNQEGLYQVEFSNAGKNLTQMEKEKIEALHLPGIDFIEEEKRYYPNGDFASYTIGYAKKDDKSLIRGELGIESLLDDVLAGEDGSITYQKDVNGYKIANTPSIEVAKKDGSNIYLTIDSNIQFFMEQALNEAYKNYTPEWIVMVLADAKTGAILGASQKPSYDPNILDIENYLDLTVATPYEPGSIMKIYTYMAALEAGTYKGNETFLSGKYVVDDDTTVYDWSKKGFGKITFDQGFLASSNVGVINIVNKFINKQIMQDYFKKMGFGTKTGITLANEEAGSINFKYQTEIYSASFGQGITTTPMQHIKALTAIANDGVMLNPYVIDQITDNDGNVLFEGTKKELGRVASKETTDYIKNLMYETVHSKLYYATATSYKMSGYDLIGKTGTAQQVNPQTGEYYTNDAYSIKSFVGMWPKNDPEVIIYVSVKRPKGGSSKPLTTSVKSVVENVSKYLNIFEDKQEKIIPNKIVDNYINKNVKDVEESLKKEGIKYIILGNKDKIIKQYPSSSNILGSNDTLFLLTNGSEYVMPDISNYSNKQARAICSLLNLDCSYDGYGYVYSQSIKKGTKITNKMKLELKLKTR